MRATRILQASLLATLLTASFMAHAAPADAGNSPGAREKAARHARDYNESPPEARAACRDRASGTACSYILPPSAVRLYDKKVEGSCWAPENSTRLPTVCR